MVKGRPEYCIGVVSSWQPWSAVMVGTNSFGTGIGKDPLLVRLICRLDTSMKVFSAAAIIFRFMVCAVVMMAVLSANCNRIVGVVGMSIRSVWSSWKIIWRISTASLKSKGVAGHPDAILVYGKKGGP
jgi:hypothetical protein